MLGQALRLTRDRLEPGSRSAFPLLHRVRYVLEGALVVDGTEVRPDSAWYGAGACAVVPGPAGATVLGYESSDKTRPAPGRPLLEHDIALDPAAEHLLRCDRVDFDLGGEAPPHRHRGGGIRCLLSGALELRIEGEPDRVVTPGQAWFESGREPVYAKASATEPTSFIRCSILPRELRGRSSIMYVNPADAGGTPRRYTVFVDEPIELPR